MSDWVLKYADARGEIHQQVAQAVSEQEVRDRFAQQGFLIYSIRPRRTARGLSTEVSLLGRRKKLNLEKFLIFNQQFVTLIRAGLPILKGLDLLADRLTDPKLGAHIKSVRDEVRKGTLLSEAFRMQGVFPKIYVTSVMAGEKSGSLSEVLDRYISYQKLALAVRKKILVSLLYPAVLIFLVLCLIVFLVTFVVPNFAQLYSSMSAQLPAITQVLIAVGTTARNYVLLFFAALVGAGFLFAWWSRKESAKEKLDAVKMHTPVLGDIWLKYQVAQFSRVLSTLLTGGIPLVQGLETAADSLGTALLRRTLMKAGKLVREGQALSGSLTATGVFPPLAIDMIEVGESTGALPVMLTSVAEFYEDDVNTKMTAALSLIEPAIMIFMGIFVAFVLIALYMPIFSLADTIH
jgi:type IV pilus assembly protein PilC